jgi:glutamate synthase (ferredoxin)
MLLVDTVQGRLVDDDELKLGYARQQPYGEWLDAEPVHLELSCLISGWTGIRRCGATELYKAFGYTYEEVKDSILPMARDGAEPTSSMGHVDTPLAVLVRKAPAAVSLFQAAVCPGDEPAHRRHPGEDRHRYHGLRGLRRQSAGGKAGKLPCSGGHNPILTGVDLMKIRSLHQPGFRAETISLLYYKNSSLENALEQLCNSCDRPTATGPTSSSCPTAAWMKTMWPIPSLLAVSRPSSYLVRTKKAHGRLPDPGERRAAGRPPLRHASRLRRPAINPYLAHECVEELIDIGMLDKDTRAIDDYNSAISPRHCQNAAKMGIIHLQSYQSAQIFEAWAFPETSSTAILPTRSQPRGRHRT